MTQRIIRADKKYRRRMLHICLLAACLGGGLIGWGLPRAERFVAELHPETAIGVLRATLFLVFVGPSAAAFYFLRLGRRVIENERFPLQDQKVIRDTRLLEGREAKTRGRGLVFLAWLILFLSLLGAFYTQHLLGELTRNRNPRGVRFEGVADRAGKIKSTTVSQPINSARISR